MNGITVFGLVRGPYRTRTIDYSDLVSDREFEFDILKQRVPRTASISPSRIVHNTSAIDEIPLSRDVRDIHGADQPQALNDCRYYRRMQ
jgi:hypothetical protein